MGKKGLLQVDDVSKLFYDKDFRIAFLEKKGTEFQDWFAKLAGHAFGDDFEAVRPYGKEGDWKCDGRQVSTDTIFQCYAPQTHTDTKVISKISDDFYGAKERWPELKAWIFVHNDDKGVSPTIANHVKKLRAENPNIEIKIWTEPNLYKLFCKMDDDAKRLMFGAVPNQSTVNNLGLKDLEPVIDALENSEPDLDNPFPLAPSPEKLKRNKLSQASIGLLNLGRTKVRLVETFFKKAGLADLGEKIAQSFQNRYNELKDLDLNADQIFARLHEHAGVYPEPQKQVAVMAVLAYFFETCDIFENPTEEDTAT